MKTIHISPYAHLGLAEQDMHLLIAPFLNDNEAYKEFYQKLPESHYTILDNGAFEKGSACPDEMLIELAKELNVNEVVAPDIMMDGPGTTGRTQEFFDIMSSKEYRNFKWQFVLQGKNIVELTECYMDNFEMVWTDVIAFPKWLDTKWNGIRAELTKRWIPEIWDHSDVHLLGLTSPRTLMECDPRVRSCDSSLAFRAATTNLYMRKDTSDMTSMDWNLTLSKRQQLIATQNIKFLQRCANGNRKV